MNAHDEPMKSLRAEPNQAIDDAAEQTIRGDGLARPVNLSLGLIARTNILGGMTVSGGCGRFLL